MITERGMTQFSTRDDQASRKLGNIVFARNDELKYTHYTLHGNSAEPLEIYIADELKMTGLPFKRLKRYAIRELRRIKSDSLGETNIDPHVSERFARSRRAVNCLRERIQGAINLPIAVKSSVESQKDSDLEKEDLIDQFLFMRELQFASQMRLSDKQKKVFGFLPVYGAIRADGQDFLIMKHIMGATEIQDREVPFITHGWAGGGDPYSEYAVAISEHKALLEAIGFDLPSAGSVRYRYITSELSSLLGMRLHDLAGRNVLYHSDGGKRKYVIIDQVRNEL